jgi:UDP-N-acetylmuramoyl-tripeptide--D-alanyl-D-alanine ligase
MEILKSPKMKMGFVHESVPIKDYDTITKFPNNLHITKSTLDGLWFDVEINGQIEHFYAPILGSFNAINLTAVILVSHYLGMSIDEIKIALKTLPQVEHRLQKIEAGGKLIIDDSFNGNLEGMLEAVNICSTYEGRKVIITGSLNSHLLSSNIDSEKVFILKDKSHLEATLAQKTMQGDLILFANDAPNFI